VLVDVIAVLVMPVAFVHVVEVVPVLNRVAAVAVRVRTRVLGVHLALFVLLAIVEMVRVVVVLNRCAPVIGQVLMVKFLGVRVHESSFSRWNFSLLPQPLRRQATPCVRSTLDLYRKFFRRNGSSRRRITTRAA
jgi:hypothetical protein